MPFARDARALADPTAEVEAMVGSESQAGGMPVAGAGESTDDDARVRRPKQDDNTSEEA